MKVYIDPGHGGHDPGAVDGCGKGDTIYTEEEDLNLDVAKRFGRALEAMGISVKYSRTSDVYPTLPQRSSAANAWGADAFVSWHHNAGGSSARGIEVLYRGGSSKGRALATKVMDALDDVSPWADRGARADVRGLHVLRATRMPAILIEGGFITNTGEEKLLADPAYRQRLADAAAGAVASWGGVKATPKPSTPPKKPVKKPSKPTTRPSGPRQPLVRRGSRGGAVKTLQAALNRTDARLAVDGVFGPNTLAAVKAYQKRKKLVVDGIVGPRTWASLGYK